MLRMSQSCSALSSINNHHAKPWLGLYQLGFRDQGPLCNDLKFIRELTSLQKRFAKLLGNANQSVGGEFGSDIFSLLETLK